MLARWARVGFSAPIRAEHFDDAVEQLAGGLRAS
jgi:hypothetical protein